MPYRRPGCRLHLRKNLSRVARRPVWPAREDDIRNLQTRLMIAFHANQVHAIFLSIPIETDSACRIRIRPLRIIVGRRPQMQLPVADRNVSGIPVPVRIAARLPRISAPAVRQRIAVEMRAVGQLPAGKTACRQRAPGTVAAARGCPLLSGLGPLLSALGPLLSSLGTTASATAVKAAVARIRITCQGRISSPAPNGAICRGRPPGGRPASGGGVRTLAQRGERTIKPPCRRDAAFGCDAQSAAAPGSIMGRLLTRRSYRMEAQSSSGRLE